VRAYSSFRNFFDTANAFTALEPATAPHSLIPFDTTRDRNKERRARLGHAASIVPALRLAACGSALSMRTHCNTACASSPWPLLMSDRGSAPQMMTPVQPWKFSNPGVGTPQQMIRAALQPITFAASWIFRRAVQLVLFRGIPADLLVSANCQLPEFRTPADSEKTRQLCGWAASTPPAHRAATRRDTPHSGTGCTVYLPVKFEIVLRGMPQRLCSCLDV
jgi:hypothetical protein